MSQNNKKPKKWTETYPQGTKEGDEEQRFFIALGRHPEYKFRTVAALAKEANISKERVEQIIAKYVKRNMVLPNPKNEDGWGYWERNKDLLPPEVSSIAQTDQKKRIDKAAS